MRGFVCPALTLSVWEDTIVLQRPLPKSIVLEVAVRRETSSVYMDAISLTVKSKHCEGYTLLSCHDFHSKSKHCYIWFLLSIYVMLCQLIFTVRYAISRCSSLQRNRLPAAQYSSKKLESDAILLYRRTGHVFLECKAF